MSAPLFYRTKAEASEIEALARLAGSRHTEGMMLSQALCWLGKGDIAAAVRRAVEGRSCRSRIRAEGGAEGRPFAEEPQAGISHQG